MKRKYLIVGSIAFFNYFARAQPTDSTSQIVKKTEIELVYNHYIQNGNNSAVTGGQGTEALTVYGPAINLKRNFKKNTYSLNMGADVITSASTDNIDYVVSSASLVDTRSYLTAGIERPVNHKNFSLHGGVGFSIESDYLSIGSKIGLFRESLDKMSTISLDFQMYNDDLRWGRLNPDEWRPVKLIYPSDLQ
ncbi:MAG: hypothetical protein OEW75_08415, partial [Cyclobacteriaceae bacterium]|nr:hypothetical protein [Cyclobacteriaceae bacterium]